VTHTLIIAEVAGCHDGELSKAITLIEQAKDVGADVVKFQWVSNPERLAERRRAPEYLEAYRTIAFNPQWFPILANHCELMGIDFMCTSYLPEDIRVVNLYVKRFKVSSFEAGDKLFLVTHREFDKPLLVSLGMGQEPALILPDTSYLHCVSAYPANPRDMNLGILRAGYLGLSDHTLHPQMGAYAVAAGAQIIEFHMRLHDTKQTNADYEVAKPKPHAVTYIKNIREVETYMGDAVKRSMPCEKEMERFIVST